MEKDVSVVICAYTEERWDDLLAAVTSVRMQTQPPCEIIVVIDHCPSLLKRVRDQIPGVVTTENAEAPGLRGARNAGIAVAQGQLIAFLDDDAIAIPEWLEYLCEGYDDPHVLGTGGMVTPRWQEQKPGWFPEEFYWVVGCSYSGMPQSDAVIRNPIGANMSIKREVFEAVGDFHSQIEDIGTRHAGGCEETELCIRARQHWPQGKFLYHPRANVFHRVPASRATWSYFAKRCYVEGLAKALVARHVGAKDGLSSERAYTLRILPLAIIRGLVDALVQRNIDGVGRAAAIVDGLSATTFGYVLGNMRLSANRLKNIVVKRNSNTSPASGQGQVIAPTIVGVEFAPTEESPSEVIAGSNGQKRFDPYDLKR
jgi:glucosyl-dolichyl phosphate glucuronosyltransferase